MSDDDLVDKFRRAAGATCGQSGTEAIIETIWSLDELEDVNELTTLVTPAT